MSNETENVTSSPPARKPRWLYGALIASLGLNLLVLGGAAGAFWKHRHGHHERGLMSFVRDLPPDRQGPLRDLITSERAKLKPIRDDIRKAWSDSNEVLGTEPFDKDKMKAAMAHVGEEEARLRSAISDAIVEAASQLTPEERQIFKAWRERAKERRHKKWRRDSDDDDGDKR